MWGRCRGAPTAVVTTKAPALEVATDPEFDVHGEYAGAFVMTPVGLSEGQFD